MDGYWFDAKISMHVLRQHYGEDERDDALIDDYLQKTYEEGRERRPPEYK